MNLQETIRIVLREELSPRIRRRLSNDEMENEFLESFEGAYRLTKNRKVLSSHFLDELLYTTITFMMDGVHWRFVSTLPEDEFWYDDIHKELENHYRDRIIQMYNERKGIKESILREETELPAYIRRRVTSGDLEWLIRDVKISLSRGKNKSDALYDAIQNLISSNRELLKDYDMFQDVYAFDEPLIKYINSKLDEEPLNESILREETSRQNNLKDILSDVGVYNTSKMVGGIKNLYKFLGFVGTQEEMILIVNTLIKHDIPIIENICDFKIVPTQNSLKLYVEIPKYYPIHPDDYYPNRQKVLQARDNISTMINKMGNGLVKGHVVEVSIGKC